MTPAQRSFVRGLVALLATRRAEAAPDVRVFVDGLLRALREHSDANSASALPETTDDPARRVEALVIERWDDLVERVERQVSLALGALTEAQGQAQALLEESPSLLAPLGQGRDERSHSELLAWALRRPGDLGRELRERFLVAIDASQPVEGWHVTAESSVGPGCRVDVDIEVPGEWRCFVEVKVDAPERKAQLADYRRHLDASCGDAVDGDLVFLTVEGRASVDAAVDHRPASFRDLMWAWLPLANRREPDALYLRLWLASMGRDLYGIDSRAGSGLAGRLSLLDVLQGLEELDA